MLKRFLAVFVAAVCAAPLAAVKLEDEAGVVVQPPAEVGSERQPLVKHIWWQ